MSRIFSASLLKASMSGTCGAWRKDKYYACGNLRKIVIEGDRGALVVRYVSLG